MSSLPPDITERPIIDLSGRTTSYYELNGNAFDVAIGGLPFIMAITDNTPYKRATADFRAQRVDQMRDPGEHTLAGSGYWTRSQSSWHYGEGIQFTEPMEGNDNEVRFRYRDSYGVDVWTPGQISLLKTTSKVQNFTGANKIVTGTDGSAHVILAADLSTTPTTAIYKITSSGVSTAFTAGSAIGGGTILDIASDGTYLYVATATKIYDINIATGTVHDQYTFNTTNAASVVMYYVKSRIVAGVTYTDGKVAALELTFPGKLTAGATVNVSTLTAISGSTTLPTNWKWTAVDEGRNAIYLAGYAGDYSGVLKLTVDNSGALTALSMNATLPKGEIIYGLFGYLGTYLAIGTNKGVRVANSDTSGDLTYGPLVLHTDYPVYAFDARDSYMWAGVQNAVNSYSGTYRFNLAQPITLSGYAQPISTGVYARASDVWADGIFGVVRSVIVLGERVAFSVDGSGVWLQSATDLVPTGQLRTGRIRYDTMENKAWKRIRVRTKVDITTGDVAISKVDPILGDQVVATIYEGQNSTYDYDLNAVFPELSSDAAFKVELARSATDATTGAVVIGIAVKALPTPTRARLLQIPLFCYDKETDKTGNMVGYEGYARERLNALELAEGLGATLIIQDFTAGGEPFEVIIEQVAFTRATPSARNYTGFGGIIQITARTVV